MDRRRFLKLLAQSSASVGATVFVERVWGFPTVALLSRNNNKLYFWGEHIADFGASTGANVTQPTKIVRRHSFTSFRVGGFAGAQGVFFGTTLKGEIYTWGNNTNYQQGATAGTLASPSLFGTTSTWNKVSPSSSHSLGLRQNGMLWAWGNNTSGQLGDGTLTVRSTPVQIGTDTWTAAEAGLNASFAIKSNGTLWTWGLNNSGYLGNGGTAALSSPVQVGVYTDWTKISVYKAHALAIRANGTLWAWGTNGMGQLGITPYVAVASSPVQVGSATDWASAYASDELSYAIKTDGSLWAWGYNTGYELGTGTNTSYSTPVRVGTANDWVALAPSFAHTLALKTNSTLWGWGNNAKGQLGIGNAVGTISTPVQIGTSTHWSSIGAVGSTSFGIRIK